MPRKDLTERKKYQDDRRRVALEYSQRYLKTHPCVDCGETDSIVLDFDHVRGQKICSVSRMVNSGWALEAIKLEVEKCEVRCANDHRRATSRRKNAGLMFNG